MSGYEVITIIMVGGLVDPIVGGCVNAMAVQAIAQMRFDRAFIGACAVMPDGIAAFHHADADFKRQLLAHAAQVVVLATTGSQHGLCVWRLSVAKMSSVFELRPRRPKEPK